MVTAGAGILRCGLGAVFLFAGIQKVRDITLFSADIQAYRLLPDALIGPAASYLPFLEIFVGAALIFRLVYLGALLLSGGMIGVFLAALGSAFGRGLDIDCGCFGRAGSGHSIGREIGIDVFLFFIWFFLAWRYVKDNSGTNLQGLKTDP